MEPAVETLKFAKARPGFRSDGTAEIIVQHLQSSRKIAALLFNSGLVLVRRDPLRQDAVGDVGNLDG